MKVYLCILTILLFCSGCFMTTIGDQNPIEYSKYDWNRRHPRVLHLHVYLDKGVSRARACKLMAKWKDEDAQLYGIDLEPDGFELMPRKFGLFHNSILDQVAAIPLKGDDDRIFYFANQRVRDYIYSYIGIFPLGIIPPEVVGEVDDPTMTHGWAWAHIESIPSMLIVPPGYATWHEFYHLIGSCPHSDDMGERGGCYERIFTLKMTPTEDGFFASMSLGGRIYHSRAEVNARLTGWRDPLWPFSKPDPRDVAPPELLPSVPDQQEALNGPTDAVNATALQPRSSTVAGQDSVRKPDR